MSRRAPRSHVLSLMLVYAAIIASGLLAADDASASAQSAAAGEDLTIGTWDIDPSTPNVPWASGDEVLTITSATKAEVEAFHKTLADPGRRNLEFSCIGQPGEPPPFDNPASVFYSATYTWKGGGTMKGCFTRAGRSRGEVALYGSGNIRATVSKVDEKTIGGAWGDAPQSEFGFTGVRNQPTVIIRELKGKAEVQLGGGAWQPAELGMELKQGDQIHTGFKAGATLEFPGEAIVQLQPMALMEIRELSHGVDGRKKVRLFLPLGEVKASVTRLRGSHGDFQVKTPTTTASVRGTKFSVLYDGTATVVAVTESSVEVTANNGSTVVVPAGMEARSTAKGVTAPVAIGHGEKRGGLTAGKARARLAAKVAKGLKKCKFDVLSNKLRPADGGWSGSFVIVAAGQGIEDKPKGTAKFRLKGKKVSATNSLAKKIAAGCR